MSSPYTKQWRRFRMMRALLLFYVLSYIPAFIAANRLDVAYFHASMVPEWGITLLWLVLYIQASLALKNWPCPRCGHAFLGSWRNSPFFTRHCRHCGLPKFARENSK